MQEQLDVSQQPVYTKTSPKEIIAYLAEKFPACFTLTNDVKPLKIGIFQDLSLALADDNTVSKTVLRSVLRRYTLSWRYLAACQANAVRVGLQGEPAGIVEPSQAEHAAQSLAESKARYAERKAKEPRKASFKPKTREQKPKKSVNNQHASSESLSALENKFAKGRK